MRDLVSLRPHVIIGARTLARAAVLEQLLEVEQRVQIMGVYTRARDIRARIEGADHPICLLLDSSLEDTSSLEFLVQNLLEQPIAAVTFSTTPHGEFAFESLRAGAVTCLPWPSEPEPLFATRLSTVIEGAWRTPAHALRHTSLQPLKGPPRAPSDNASRSVILACGTRAIASVFDAATRLPSDVHAALVAIDAIDESLAPSIARKLSRFSHLRLSSQAHGPLRRGHIYLFDDAVSLASDARGKYPTPRRPPSGRSGLGEGGMSAWLRGLSARLERDQLEHVTILVNGYIDLSTTDLIGHAVSQGAILAEHTAGGFQVRWLPASPFQKHTTDAFWSELQRRLST